MLDTDNRRERTGRAWRNVTAVALIAGIALGTFVWTDDAWPFAPFRMFAAATKRTGRVVKAEFRAELADGTEVELDALDLGLRRAEVEGQLGSVAEDDDKLGDLALAYNSRVEDPGRQIVRLELVQVGSRLEDGVPTDPVDETMNTWSAP